jgi:hypothetical protein
MTRTEEQNSMIATIEPLDGEPEAFGGTLLQACELATNYGPFAALASTGERYFVHGNGSYDSGRAHRGPWGA